MPDEVVKGRRSAEMARRTRTGIVDAALALFSSRGYDGVSIRDIAAAAGTTHGLIRHHFGSKAGIWEAVVTTADDHFAGSMRPVLAAVTIEDDPTHALTVLVRGLVDTARRHPEIVRLLVLESAEPSDHLNTILDLMQPLRTAIAALVPTLHQNGQAADFDADSLFLHLLLAATAPVALAGLTNAVLRIDPLDDTYGRRHADRIVAMLLDHPPDRANAGPSV